jgi:hypothetical protein
MTQALGIDETFAVAAAPERIERAAQALRGKGFTVLVVDTPAEARATVADLLPTDVEIYTAVSETLRLSGIDADVNESGRYRSLKKRLHGMDFRKDGETIRKAGCAPDVVIGSVHAVTEDGRLVAASATGGQLAAYAAGAAKAFWVIGAQKVVPDLTAALCRIETYAYPKEDARAREVYGRPSEIAKVLIVNTDRPGRGTVVLIRQAIGF